MKINWWKFISDITWKALHYSIFCIKGNFFICMKETEIKANKNYIDFFLTSYAICNIKLSLHPPQYIII